MVIITEMTTSDSGITFWIFDNMNMVHCSHCITADTLQKMVMMVMMLHEK